MTVVRSMLLLVASGCAAHGQLPVQMAALTTDAGLEGVPQYVELHHQDDGWLRVPADAGEPKMAKLASGEHVDLVLAKVPRGVYTAVRIGVVTSAPENTRRTVTRYSGEPVGATEEGSGLVHDATVVQQRFCVNDKNEDDLRLTVRQSGPDRFPTFQIEEAPSC